MSHYGNYIFHSRLMLFCWKRVSHFLFYGADFYQMQLSSHHVVYLKLVFEYVEQEFGFILFFMCVLLSSCKSNCLAIIASAHLWGGTWDKRERATCPQWTTEQLSTDRFVKWMQLIISLTQHWWLRGFTQAANQFLNHLIMWPIFMYVLHANYSVAHSMETHCH